MKDVKALELAGEQYDMTLNALISTDPANIVEVARLTNQLLAASLAQRVALGLQAYEPYYGIELLATTNEYLGQFASTERADVENWVAKMAQSGRSYRMYMVDCQGIRTDLNTFTQK